MDDDYESILLIKSEVFVYKIPPMATNRGYRAADWNLGEPDWSGRMRLVSKKKDCILKLEDKLSGELFAQCPIDKYPGIAIEAVSDSSRYFVVRVQDDGVILALLPEDDEVSLKCVVIKSRSAFLGIGFGDRSDSFDLNVTLQEHFKWLKKEEEAEKEKEEGKPNLDLGFKEGQTIKINMKIAKKGQETGTPGKTKPKSSMGGMGIIPPPPGGIKLGPPPLSSKDHQHQPASNVNFLGNLEQSEPAQKFLQNPTENWGEFTSAPPPPTSNNTAATNQSNVTANSWVTF